MRYKYLKGSEKDFDGAPDWAEIKTRIEMGEFWLGGRGLGYECQMLGSDAAFEVTMTPDNEEVIAERRPITEPEWDGVGLPPAGCECEFISDKSWWRVNVICYDGDKVVFKPSGDEYYAAAPVDKCKFRQLRTDADKKREEICTAIYGALTKAEREHNRSDEADAVYDAIASGKIPGVKLED